MSEKVSSSHAISDENQAVCDGAMAIACIRLGLDNEAYVWTIHAVRAGARALAGVSVAIYTVDIRKDGLES